MERPLTARIRPGKEPPDLKAYEHTGGYQALRKALREMSPKAVHQVVEDSNLLGRGGAGFPTGKKWASMPPASNASRPRYFLVDADEMEPGAFKDRFLMEGDPHQLIEGVILGSYAVDADVAYIFLRWEYTTAASLLKNAIAEAYERNYLGRNILGSDFSLELRLHRSAGRYICGEGTAMIEALEGKRAVPRDKLPRTTVAGLWNKPSCTNNVETLCSVSHIVLKGADWFRGLSLGSEGGTKIYGVSGKVKRPGAWELPMGTTMRELLEDHAGGMRDGLKFRAAIPGGASAQFVLEEHLDTAMDFGSMGKAGSRLGTGTMIVMDDRTCPVGMVNNLIHFFARESCGWCTPCREGLPWLANILKAIEEGSGQDGDLEQLQAHTHLLGMGKTFCALAPGAMFPLASGLKYFREDFEQHIREKRCSWR
jgi:NADH-quinone oxidoreductase subunit F